MQPRLLTRAAVSALPLSHRHSCHRLRLLRRVSTYAPAVDESTQCESGYFYCLTAFSGRVLFEELSLHGSGLVKVIRYGPWAALRCGSTEQGVAYVGGEDADDTLCVQPRVLCYDYLRTMVAAHLAVSALNGGGTISCRPVELLCVGLGSCALPSFLALQLTDAHVSVVEIDPLIARAVTERMGVDLSPLQITVADAAEHVSQLAEQVRSGQAEGCSTLFLDAYDPVRGIIPFHLRGGVFLADCKTSLSVRGCIVVNCFTGSPNSAPRRDVESFVKQLITHFGVGAVFSVKGGTNVVLVALKADGLLVHMAKDDALVSHAMAQAATAAAAAMGNWPSWDPGAMLSGRVHVCRVDAATGQVDAVAGGFEEDNKGEDDGYGSLSDD